MDPRLKTSRKWTALPKELLGQMRSVFQSTFKDQLGTSKIEAEGRIYPEEILLMVGIRAGGALKQSNFQVSIGYKKDKDNAVKLIQLGMDAIGALFEQFFSAEDDAEFPRIWEEIDFEGRKIHVQYTTENSELEAAADKFLGKAGGSLAEGDWDDEVSPDAIKASLGIDPEDDSGEDDGGREH